MHISAAARKTSPGQHLHAYGNLDATGREQSSRYGGAGGPGCARRGEAGVERGGVVPMAAGGMGPHAFTASCYFALLSFARAPRWAKASDRAAGCSWGAPWGRGSRAGNLKMTLEEASELFDSLDVDDDGVLTKSEFTGGMESFYQSFLPDMSVMVKRASSFKGTSLVSLSPPKALRAGDMSIGFSLSPSSDKKTSSGAGKVPKRGAKKRPAWGAAGKKRPAEIGTTI